MRSSKPAVDMERHECADDLPRRSLLDDAARKPVIWRHVIKISILTAVWNRASTLAAAIESLDTQSHSDWEHIVQDGGSTDGSLALLAARNDPRRDVQSGSDGGIYDALNRAFARSSGDIIGILHSDDIFADSSVLAKVAHCFEETGADAVYGDLNYVAVDDVSHVIRYWKSGTFQRRRLHSGWMPPHPTLYLRRDVITRLGGYDTSFQIAADYDAILRYFVAGEISAAYIPHVLTKMRVGGASNRSIQQIIRKSAEDYRAIRKNKVGGVKTMITKNVRKIPQFFQK